MSWYVVLGLELGLPCLRLFKVRVRDVVLPHPPSRRQYIGAGMHSKKPTNKRANVRVTMSDTQEIEIALLTHLTEIGFE